jgi:hypothetical protein
MIVETVVDDAAVSFVFSFEFSVEVFEVEVAVLFSVVVVFSLAEVLSVSGNFSVSFSLGLSSASAVVLLVGSSVVVDVELVDYLVSVDPSVGSELVDVLSLVELFSAGVAATSVGTSLTTFIISFLTQLVPFHALPPGQLRHSSPTLKNPGEQVIILGASTTVGGGLAIIVTYFLTGAGAYYFGDGSTTFGFGGSGRAVAGIRILLTGARGIYLRGGTSTLRSFGTSLSSTPGSNPFYLFNIAVELALCSFHTALAGFSVRMGTAGNGVGVGVGGANTCCTVVLYLK